MSRRCFEDICPGETHAFGRHTLSEDEMTEFAQDFDPQPFHIDDEAARNSIFGGLIASGWYTSALMMRMFVEHVLKDCVTVGSPGFDELRWHKPVRVGDTLSVRATCVDCSPSRSQPGLGSVDYELRVFNQDEQLVSSVRYIVLVRRRGDAGTRPA